MTDANGPKVATLIARYKSTTIDDFVAGHAVDVGQHGIFMKTTSPCAPGTLVNFEVRLAGDEPVLAGVGRVTWARDGASSQPAGIGIRFITLQEEFRTLIQKIQAAKGAEAGSAYEAGVVEFGAQHDSVQAERSAGAGPSSEVRSGSDGPSASKRVAAKLANLAAPEGGSNDQWPKDEVTRPVSRRPPAQSEAVPASRSRESAARPPSPSPAAAPAKPVPEQIGLRELDPPSPAAYVDRGEPSAKRSKVGGALVFAAGCVTGAVVALGVTGYLGQRFEGGLSTPAKVAESAPSASPVAVAPVPAPVVVAQVVPASATSASPSVPAPSVPAQSAPSNDRIAAADHGTEPAPVPPVPGHEAVALSAPRTPSTVVTSSPARAASPPASTSTDPSTARTARHHAGTVPPSVPAQPVVSSSPTPSPPVATQKPAPTPTPAVDDPYASYPTR